MKKTLICDLDGTIRRSNTANTFIHKPLEVEIIPRSKEKLIEFKETGWTIVGCSNQGGVQAGFLTLEECFQIQFRTLNLCEEINNIIISPDNDTAYNIYRHKIEKWIFDGKWLKKRNTGILVAESEGTRKPNCGMIKIIKYEDNRDSDFFLFVGDLPSDEELADNAGLDYADVSHWHDLPVSFWEKSLTTS